MLGKMISMSSRILPLLVLSIVLIGCGSDPSRSVNLGAPLGTGFQLLSFNDAMGKPRNYSVFVPLNYSPGKPTPAILFLHGQFEGGSDGKKCTTVGIGQAIKKNPQSWDFVTIFPQSANGMWNDTDRHNALLALADVEKRYSVDKKRVILTGLSTGGEGTWLLGSEAPDKFAAYVPMCAGAEPQTVPLVAKRPVWAFHNKGDPFRSHGSSASMVKKINEAGGNAKLTSYLGILSHNCWDRAYSEPDLLPWMRKQMIK